MMARYLHISRYKSDFLRLKSGWLVYSIWIFSISHQKMRWHFSLGYNKSNTFTYIQLSDHLLEIAYTSCSLSMVYWQAPCLSPVRSCSQLNGDTIHTWTIIRRALNWGENRKRPLIDWSGKVSDYPVTGFAWRVDVVLHDSEDENYGFFSLAVFEY